MATVGKDGGDKRCCCCFGCAAPTIVLGNIGGDIAATCDGGAGNATDGDIDITLPLVIGAAAV